jgi:hypothetical protein
MPQTVMLDPQEQAALVESLSNLTSARTVALIDAKWFAKFNDYIAQLKPTDSEKSTDQHKVQRCEEDSSGDLLYDIRLNKDIFSRGTFDVQDCRP